MFEAADESVCALVPAQVLMATENYAYDIARYDAFAGTLVPRLPG
jgi:hypothetical protein